MQFRNNSVRFGFDETRFRNGIVSEPLEGPGRYLYVGVSLSIREVQMQMYLEDLKCES